MSFSCGTQLPVMTLVPTYTFVGNLFQAFVMMHELAYVVQDDLVWFGEHSFASPISRFQNTFLDEDRSLEPDSLFSPTLMSDNSPNQIRNTYFVGGYFFFVFNVRFLKHRQNGLGLSDLQ